MARPPLNAARPSGPTVRTLSKLPAPPAGMKREQAAIYRRYGQLLVDAGSLAATDLPMLESTARVRANLDAMYGRTDGSPATIAALERLHKECLIQLGLTPTSRRASAGGGSGVDAERERIRGLLE
jgi:hypothetical protein